MTWSLSCFSTLFSRYGKKILYPIYEFRSYPAINKKTTSKVVFGTQKTEKTK
jgi:hypothetical protein